MYEGESNENRKHFLRFNLLNESGTQLYHFSTVSISFNTGPPVFTKCMDSSRKKFLWLSAQPLMHRLLYLFIRTELVMLQKDTSSQKSTSLWSDCRSKMILQEIWIWGTGDSVPPRRVVLQERVSIIFPADGCVRNFLGFWWWGKTPFLARSLCFRLVVHWRDISNFYFSFTVFIWLTYI
jgi:hypothetical protein